MRIKWNYTVLKRLIKNLGNQREMLKTLYYGVNNDVIFTDSLILLIDKQSKKRTESFMIYIETLDHVDFNNPYPVETLYKIINDNITKTRDIIRYNVTMVDNILYYDINDSRFQKKLVDDTLKAVGYKFEYFMGHAKVSDRVLVLDNEFASVMILGVRKKENE